MNNHSSPTENKSESLPLDLTRVGFLQEHPQQSCETYVKRIPELLAAAVETNWDRRTLCVVSVSNIVPISDYQ